jgi:hypothetical protein
MTELVLNLGLVHELLNRSLKLGRFSLEVGGAGTNERLGPGLGFHEHSFSCPLLEIRSGARNQMLRTEEKRFWSIKLTFQQQRYLDQPSGGEMPKSRRDGEHEERLEIGRRERA